ncbi:MAG: transcriptional regulator PpsR [Pseudomonadota bacterium]
MTPDGASLRLIPAEAVDAFDVLSAVLRTATDVTISLRQDGTIQAAVLNASNSRSHGLSDWVGHHISTVITAESQVKLDRAMAAAQKMSESGTLDLPPMELNHLDSTGFEMPVRYRFVKVKEDETVLMLGQDLTAISDAQQALVRTQHALETEHRNDRERNTLYRVLKSRTQDCFLYLSERSGRILDITDAAATLFGTTAKDALDKPFGRILGDFGATLDTLLSSERHHSDPIKALLPNGTEAAISAERFRTANDLVALVHISTEPGATVQEPWSLFTSATPDAAILLDSSGNIQAANPSALSLLEKAQVSDVIGLPMSEILSRGNVDWSVLRETITEFGTVQAYETSIQTGFDTKVPVMLSAARIVGQDQISYGISLRLTSTLDLSEGMPLNDPDSVAELVGKVSLKDIVSQTTDVIEKICIETAIKLTKNNRFAAAEMLSLSRQSLYVKLRKYGLIGKSDDE